MFNPKNFKTHEIYELSLIGDIEKKIQNCQKSLGQN